MLLVSRCSPSFQPLGEIANRMIEEYGTPDEENPEWTDEDFARSLRFKDLPEQLQRTLSGIQRKRNAVLCSAQGEGEKQATAKTNADSLRE